ncbi:hypothetical protein CathTA2_1933 [Caldalkalibacillus thermarum TA2.A1]|uniref:YheC/YheD family protein n=1 Tax=Caldalkalibacillus thermarum (strain TA2.A1) TaxID=986075 RepID=F5L7Y3_CALTT|nr:YheC/YheD family protein [Caldalkalibacillus thermarum]EGL82571.1 hypothetical protein CathTA2_1933 [Caldalkalibacillus thermarum TA2.A1]QZT34780.1 YheC/YheD family protein [Caldalkalibacillus thermarum TA2.A1]
MMKKVTIAYSPADQEWYLLAQPKRGQTVNRHIYWGANRLPLKLSIARKPPLLPCKPLTMNAYIRLKKRKPLLGPVVGILTVQGNDGSFTGSKPNFIELMRTGQYKGGIVFVFTPESVNWLTEEVRGQLYHPQLKKWFSCQFPLPNVVYNRIPLRSFESKSEVQICLELLSKHPRISLFNPCFFDKNELFRLLKEGAETARYLPRTELLEDSNLLSEMIAQHQEVYLKPTSAKAGKGIFKAGYDQDKGRYTLLFHQGLKTKRVSTPSIERLWKGFQKLKFPSPYIIQQAVDLAQIDGCPFDLRTLIQKNKYGTWEITGIGIRVAGRKRITTHVPQGGRIEDPAQVLPQVFTPEKAEEIVSQVKQLALEVAQELEGHYHHLGEMSLDIGVDSQGQLWLFEANAKPMKFDEPHIRRKSLENLIEYAQYLTFKTYRKGVSTNETAQAN